MERCYFSECNSGTELAKIPNRDIWVCLLCLDSFSKIRDKWTVSELDPDNCICNLCFVNPASYVTIDAIPVRKLCLTCASQTTKTGSLMYVKLKWAKVIKSHEDYTRVKTPLTIVKKSFQELLSTVDDSIEELEPNKKRILEAVDLYFDKKIELIEKQCENVEKFCKELMKKAKSCAMEGNLQRANTRVANALKSKFERDKFKTLEPCELQIPDALTLSEFMNGLVKIKTVDEHNLTYDENLIYFSHMNNTMNAFNLETGNTMPILTNECGWKKNAFWGVYENGDILYSGGEISGKASGQSFLISSDHIITPVPDCDPKSKHFTVIFNGYMYNIGGTSRSTQKFHKDNKIWQSFTQTPEKLESTSCVTCPSGILISSFRLSELLLFDPKKDSYSVIQSPFRGTTNKLLLQDGENLFCLTANGLFVSNINSSNVWEKKKDGLIEEVWCTLCTPRIIGERIYFLANNLKVWEFNAAMMTVSPVEVFT
ncbi:hypothetical protein SteCoe_18612 [Stentor coeruleus]|uniref:Uncharacterized protein n=1 Tax=Stentor coeruleus TaxID=5963 RepID=A0A1R2BW00_9CILI|nr:hypothetical protein SteCoe_18612 [Stentor coeruleus]